MYNMDTYGKKCPQKPEGYFLVSVVDGVTQQTASLDRINMSHFIETIYDETAYLNTRNTLQACPNSFITNKTHGNTPKPPNPLQIPSILSFIMSLHTHGHLSYTEYGPVYNLDSV